MAESDLNRFSPETDQSIDHEADLLRPLQIELFRGEGLVHGFFDRRGGVSTGPFAGLNVGFGVGDRPEAVQGNRARLKKALDLDVLVSARQVHGDKVMTVEGEPEDDFVADGCDALISDRRLGLMIQQADCQAVILYDPLRPAIGAAHVGWRGSVAGIIGKTVRAMSETFASKPAGLKAAISPSLGPCCAEFINYRRELPEWMHDFQVRSAYFDFWAISRAQLREAGLLSANIEKAGVCTRCSNDYFSYRRNALTGRNATVIGLFK